MIALLTRMAPSRPYVKPKTANNFFHDVLVELDPPAQAAVIYLQRLIKDELHEGFILDALHKENCTQEQLLRLSVILSGGVPDSGNTASILLNHIQFTTLAQYLAQQINHVLEHKASRVWDVSVDVVRPQLQALWDALYHKRTRILTWKELCLYSSAH